MSEPDFEYFTRRIRQERESAARCVDMCAKRAHQELAARYSAILYQASQSIRLA